MGLAAKIETDSGAESTYQKISELIWTDDDDILRIRTKYFVSNEARIAGKKPLRVVETQVEGGSVLILQGIYALLKAASPELSGAEDVLVDEWKDEKKTVEVANETEPKCKK
jgi:hypothetical protein